MKTTRKVVLPTKDIPKEAELVFKLPALKSMLEVSEYYYSVKMPPENVSRLVEISKSKEFAKYSSFLEKKEMAKEWKTFLIDNDVFFDLVGEESDEKIEYPFVFATDGNVSVVFEKEISYQEFVEFCEFAYRMKMSVRNKGYWKKFALERYPGNFYLKDNSFFVLGLCKEDSFVSREDLEIATINGFRERFLEFAEDRGVISRFFSFLSEEEKKKFKGSILREIMREVVRRDVRTLLSGVLAYDRELFVFAKDEIREYLSWLFSISPKVFKEKLYDIKPDTLKIIGEFLPEEVSDYVSRKIISSL